MDEDSNKNIRAKNVYTYLTHHAADLSIFSD